MITIFLFPVKYQSPLVTTAISIWSGCTRTKNTRSCLTGHPVSLEYLLGAMTQAKLYAIWCNQNTSFSEKHEKKDFLRNV